VRQAVLVAFILAVTDTLGGAATIALGMIAAALVLGVLAIMVAVATVIIVLASTSALRTAAAIDVLQFIAIQFAHDDLLDINKYGCPAFNRAFLFPCQNSDRGLPTGQVWKEVLMVGKELRAYSKNVQLMTFNFT
jgi:hypothetical protein